MQGREATGFPALRRCVNVEPTDFAADYWSRRALISLASTLPRDFTDLLDVDAVDELLSRRGVRTPFLRVAKAGTIRPAASYTRGGGAGADVADQVADDKVLDLLADGNTLVLQGLHRLWPPLIDFAAALRAEIAHPVQVNAYVTPRSSQGFAHHYDIHDVFVLQVSGAKRWQIHEPVFPDPLRTQPWTDRQAAVQQASTGTPLINVVLEPGDALYLPRGYVHGAQAMDGVSLHLTVGVHSVTRFAIVDSLLAEAAAEPALRSSLPLGLDLADPEAVADEVRATIAALIVWLERFDPNSPAEGLRREIWGRNRPAPLAPIRTATALSALDEQSVITLRPYLDLYWAADGARLRVETATQTLDLDACAESTLATLRSGGAVRLGEIPDLDREAAIALGRELLRTGIAVLV
ncbi:MAG: cupin domain-containing protein [Actinomycetota bacterium]|nr:cupin domain-containing protein [Actinomycetota bacterium]